MENEELVEAGIQFLLQGHFLLAHAEEEVEVVQVDLLLIELLHQFPEDWVRARSLFIEEVLYHLHLFLHVFASLIFSLGSSQGSFRVAGFPEERKGIFLVDFLKYFH